MEKRVYFDWAASAYGNPSSQHKEGHSAKNALENARERCAKVLNVPPQTLYFTSGGTESNSIALFSNLRRPGKGRIIASAGEHSSVREGMETLERMGKPTGCIAIDSAGRVTEEFLLKALNKYGDVRFVTALSVNNETGSITDIASLTNVTRKYSSGSAPIHFHCDLVQAIGKIPADIEKLDIDSASLSAHKLGGPRGIGLLYLKKPIEVFYTGGGQENGIRGGTENTDGALAFADCLEKYAFLMRNVECGITNGKSVNSVECGVTSGKSVEERYVLAKGRWKRLIDSLLGIERCRIIPGCRSSGDDSFSPFILQAAFKDIPGEVMARALDDLGFAVSTGSACSSSSPERPVLMAMGVEENLRIEGIRISQGHETTDEDIELLLGAIKEVLKFL